MKIQIPLLSDLTTRLSLISDAPALDASVLLAHIIGKPRTWVMAHPELTLTTDQQNRLDDSLARLESGEPLPYVIGNWEFFGLDFEVTSDVLIPRPETELLLEKAIAWLQSSKKISLTAADIGTGCGAIAISLAVHVPNVNILATDISSEVLQVAKHNAENHSVNNRINFIECDLLPDHRQYAADPSSLDLLCANLPYIPTQTLMRLPVYGREPTVALDGGGDGLDLIRRLLQIAPQWLAPNGMMLLEIEASQGLKALSLAYDAFEGARINLHQDLAGRDRLLGIEFRSQDS